LSVSHEQLGRAVPPLKKKLTICDQLRDQIIVRKVIPGGHVIRVQLARGRGQPGEAEIAQFDDSGGRNHHVFGLHVSVNYLQIK